MNGTNGLNDSVKIARKRRGRGRPRKRGLAPASYLRLTEEQDVRVRRVAETKSLDISVLIRIFIDYGLEHVDEALDHREACA
jgi:hypothetical protein